jgi:hypothetical protein
VISAASDITPALIRSVSTARMVIVPRYILLTKRFALLGLREVSWLIVDESHELTKKSLDVLDDITRSMTLALTATPEDNILNTLRLAGLKKFMQSTVSSQDLTHALPFLRKHLIRSDNQHSAQKVHIHVDDIDPDPFIVRVNDLLVGVGDLGHAEMGKIKRILAVLAGGGPIYIDALMGTLKILLGKSTPSTWTIIEGKPPITYMETDCPICMAPYDDPVVLSCGHVLCTTCLQGVLQVNCNCPCCRRGIRDVSGEVKVYMLVEKDTTVELGPIVPPEAYIIGGKRVWLKNKLRSYIATRGRKSQLVIYAKYDLDGLYDVVKNTSLTVTMAGILGTSRKTSMDNVTRFHQGEFDVIFMGWTTSHDMSTADHMFIVNHGDRVSDLKQLMGRVRRVGQKHTDTHVHLAHFRTGYDQYVYTQLQDGSVTNSKTSLRQMEMMLTREVSGSRFGDLFHKLSIMLPCVQVVPHAHGMFDKGRYNISWKDVMLVVYFNHAVYFKLHASGEIFDSTYDDLGDVKHVKMSEALLCVDTRPV